MAFLATTMSILSAVLSGSRYDNRGSTFEGLLLTSLAVNVGVAGSMSYYIWTNAPMATPTFGPDCVSRRILGSVYFAIAAASAVAVVTDGNTTCKVASVLLPMQIVYKLSTLLSVSATLDRKNPVPWANLYISVLHGATLYAMHKSGVLLQ